MILKLNPPGITRAVCETVPLAEQSSSSPPRFPAQVRMCRTAECKDVYVHRDCEGKNKIKTPSGRDGVFSTIHSIAVWRQIMIVHISRAAIHSFYFLLVEERQFYSMFQSSRAVLVVGRRRTHPTRLFLLNSIPRRRECEL